MVLQSHLSVTKTVTNGPISHLAEAIFYTAA